MGFDEMMAGKEPFFWGGNTNEAVLCIHGFTGSPGIYRQLGRRLKAAGFTVSAPLLPGHGSQPEALNRVGAQDWIDAADAEYRTLANIFERVHIVGLSLGGAIATLLGAGHAGENSLGKLVLMAPGYSLNPALLQRIRPFLESGGQNNEMMIPIPSRQPEGNELDECIFGYAGAPVQSVRHLLNLGKQALDAVPEVKSPTLLLYTAADVVADPALCAEAAKAFTAPVEVVCFEQSEHSLLLGCDREETMSRIVDFLR